MPIVPSAKPQPYATAPTSFPLIYTGLPLIPCAMPPVCSITGPENFARIKCPDGPLSFITPNTLTLKFDIVSPTITVFAIPSIPVCTS